MKQHEYIEKLNIQVYKEVLFYFIFNKYCSWINIKYI